MPQGHERRRGGLDPLHAGTMGGLQRPKMRRADMVLFWGLQRRLGTVYSRARLPTEKSRDAPVGRC